jgi:two-component system OmpR family response regulator
LSTSPHLLLVDDERGLRAALCDYLEKNGCRITQASDAAAARAVLSRFLFDLVIMDVMMPGEDGLSLCRFICEHLSIPVILLTAKADESERIVGLEIGADDYVVKPFNPRELLALSRAVIRRARSLPPAMTMPAPKAFRFGSWTVSVVTIPLTSREFRLLHTFLVRPRVVLSREQLLEIAQGRESGPFDRTIDNQVSRLRRKIEPDPANPTIIKTVWGGGYLLDADVVVD